MAKGATSEGGGSISLGQLMCGGGIWGMFVFMSLVVTVWGLWECLLCSGRC